MEDTIYIESLFSKIYDMEKRLGNVEVRLRKDLGERIVRLEENRLQSNSQEKRHFHIKLLLLEVSILTLNSIFTYVLTKHGILP